MNKKRLQRLMSHHQAALRGKLARRLGLTLTHNPYRKHKRGFGRSLFEAWEDGWKEQAREIATERAIKKYMENSPGGG